MTEVPLRLRAAHVVALSALAVAQPLLDVLGQNPTFFVAHHAGRGQVLLTALVVALVPPAVLVGVEALVQLVAPRWAWRVHLVLLGALAALVAAAVLDDVAGTVVDDLPLVSGPLALLLSVGLGGLFVRAYRRFVVLRSTLTMLVVAPVVFLVFFAFASPANELLFPPRVTAADVQVRGDRPPIVVLVLDELPLASVLTRDADALDAERFPNLARLAADGTWYPDATSVAAYTHEAVPAVLTGRSVGDENLPPTVSGHPDSLFTLLANDYTITAHEQLTELCTPTLCDDGTGAAVDDDLGVLLSDLGVVAGRVVLPAALNDWLPTVDDTWANFGQDPLALDQEADRLADERAEIVDGLGDAPRVQDLREAIAGIEADDDPHLTFIHTVFPHVPWSYLADGTPYPDPGNPGLVDNEWSDQAAGDRGMQRHLLQAQFADRLVGELLDRLDEEGIYDEAIVALVADHGTTFQPGSHRRLPEPSSLDSLMPVPLIVKPPAGVAVAEAVDDRPAETVDLVPTIADLLDVEVPWDLDGRSLVGPAPEPHPREMYARGDRFEVPAGPLDVASMVDRIWERFEVDGALELHGLGEGAELIGERTRRLVADPDDEGDPSTCWVPADPVPGTAGWVGGRLETDLDGALDLAVSVAGRVAGTAPTFAEGDEDHRVFVLADPTGWDGAELELWRVVGDGLVAIPVC